MTPKISVITVVYNAVDAIEKTVESVRRQTYENLEFVVVDGASTDGTLEFLERHSEAIDQFVSEPDDGLYHAMNKGKDLSTGDFAIFMNAGDLFVDDGAVAAIANSIDDREAAYEGNTIVYFDDDYKVAPGNHHQSLFFPRSFLDAEDYRTDKYRITAEGDYIYRMIDQRKLVKLDVDLIFSRIEGMRVHCYSTIAGTREIYAEVTDLMAEHGSVIPLSFRLTYPLKSLVKYGAFKIGGLPLVARVLLGKYKSSTRSYDTGLLP